MKLDIIVPTLNEEETVEKLYNEVNTIFNDIKYNLIFVDDGSTDNTLSILKYLYKNDNEHIKVISFSRNFGKDAAIHAGLSASTAEYAVIVDADMQQHPKYILKMLEFLKDNPDYDVVCMVNNYKNEGILQKIGKRTFYKLMKKSTNQNYVPGASDFRLMRHSVVKALTSMHESNRFTKGLFSYAGFKTHYIDYKPDKRIAGKSKFKLKSQITYAINGIFNFSTLPLRFASILGGTISFGAFIYLLITVIKTIVQGKDVPGYASLMCVLLILGGLILFVLGIIGEYVSRTYIEIKNRPVYIVKEKIGYKEDIL
ncbi:MAG: glycosyltransferase family 2 protein [Bacilli bacterium]|nr:glycosyltransferase family 2 protein [Bacilli bacterium]